MRMWPVFLSILVLSVMTDDRYPWLAFDLAEIEQRHADAGRDYFEFLDEESMHAGLYVVEAGEEDQQSPHALDEIYYVVRGQADFFADGDTTQTGQGDVIYVRSGIEHRFQNITETLATIVVFVASEPSTDDPAWRIFHPADQVQGENPDDNVWNDFLKVSTLTTGLYMLSVTLGGDEVLTHEIDEINIVLEGKAGFSMGEGEIEVRPGSIVYVRNGVGHKFHSLTGNFKVIILFAKQ